MKKINGRYYDIRRLDLDEMFDFMRRAHRAVPLAEYSSLHIAEDVVQLDGDTYFIYTPIGQNRPEVIELVGEEAPAPDLQPWLANIIYRDYEIEQS